MIVTVDPTEVADLVAGGERVVVVVPEGETAPPVPAGPGRVAVLVADPADPASRDLAAEMGADVFGS